MKKNLFVSIFLIVAFALAACAPSTPATDQAPRRLARRALPSVPTNAPTATASSNTKAKFTPQQIAGRLRQLRNLFDEGLLTEAFYKEKVAECYAQQ